MQLNIFDENVKQTFRRKSWTVCVKLSPKKDTNNHKLSHSRISLDHKALVLRGDKRGRQLWKKVSETLVLPLVYVKVKESRVQPPVARPLRQHSTVIFKIQVNIFPYP